MIMNFKLNGAAIKINAEPNERLSSILRREFNLKDIKQDSLQGRTGASMVLMNNKPVPASLVPAFNVEGCEIITLDFFKNTEDYKEIMTVFKEIGVAMCGFCDAGKIFLTYKIMHSNLDADSEDLNEKIKTVYSASVCRCTCLNDLIAAARRLLKLERRK